MDTANVMGTQEAANYINVSLDQFRRLIKMGYIKGFQLKPRTPRIFQKDELDEYQKKHKN